MKALYRRYRDTAHASGTYHKKDGTNIRAILKVELCKELKQVAKSGSNE